MIRIWGLFRIIRSIRAIRLISILLVLSFFTIPTQTNAGLIIRLPSSLGLTTGLVGHWTFDAQNIYGTTAYDKTSNNNDGTITGPIPAEGKIGQALDFNGSSNHVDISGESDYRFNANTEDFSVSLWFARDEDLGMPFIDKRDANDDGWRLSYIAATDKTACSLNALDVYSDLSTTDVNWHHLVCVYDRDGNLDLYYDGAYQNSTALNSEAMDTTKNVRIGWSQYAPITYYDGKIDDVRIYNRALSEGEIKRLYNMGGTLKIGKTDTDTLNNGLVGHWTFDGTDVYGSTALDKSGQGNSGTITSATPTEGKIGQALDFDGSDDYIQTTSNELKTADSFTMTTWFKTNTTACCHHILWEGDTTGNGWSGNGEQEFHLTIGYNPVDGLYDDGIQFFLGNVFGQPNADHINLIYYPFTDVGKWTFAAVTVSNLSTSPLGELFINGVSATTTDPGTVAGTARSGFDIDLRIGRPSTDERYFDGEVDDVRIYNRALSQEEITRLYNMGATLKINKTPSASSGQALTTGLVGHWTFDGADVYGNTALDKSGNGNSGAITGDVTTEPGKIGQAMKFDGDDDYILVNETATLTGLSNITLSIWLSPDLNEQTGIFGVVNGEDGALYNNINMDNNGAQVNNPLFTSKIRIGADADTRNTTQFFSPTFNWIHFAYTYDGAYERMYANGELLDSWAKSGALWSNTEYGLLIGDRYTANPNPSYKGLMDDARVYNRALSDEEVRRLYNLGR